jgi:hypothetical protein
VWRTVLRLYAQRGRPPELNDIVAETGINADDVAGLLRALRSHDLIDIDPRSEDIRLVYPFTQAPTGHCVEFNGQTLHALCAIDALRHRCDVQHGHQHFVAMPSVPFGGPH